MSDQSDDSIGRLTAGLKQFLSTVHASERELFERLAQRQDPTVMFITCADSRVSPSLITQTKPGELFVLRNMANIVPPYSSDLDGEAAAVEYAVGVLKVRDIIVCGHSGCGGVKAALAGNSDELPAVNEWLRHAEMTRRIVQEHFSGLAEEDQLRAAVEVNVMSQLSNLRTHPAVASAMVGGRLRLHGWVYDIGMGSVSAFDSAHERFVSLTDPQAATAV
jgi:carbonic anhydrase